MQRVRAALLFGAVLALAPVHTPAQPTKPLRPIDRVLKQKAPPDETTVKIVGGKPAPPGKYPFQVALIASSFPEGQEFFGQFCGGALIAPNWVLTAAHCVPNTSAEEVDVYIGANVLPKKAPGTGTRLNVTRIVSHNAYVDATKDNDIALLRLDSNAPASLKPAIIATAEIEKSVGAVGKPLIVIGWGDTSEAGSASNELREVEVMVQDSAVCHGNYQSAVPGVAPITKNMFCAGTPKGGKDSCQGDSGGFIGAPFQRAHAELGIVSWGIGCARPNLFGVYTRVSNYVDWIAKTMKSN